MPPRFKAGESVEFHPATRLPVPRGPYVVTAVLPESDGEFHYRIKHPKEAHERSARESELDIP